MEHNNLILNNKEIHHKIKRMAFQILEFYDGKSELIIAGIADNGYVFAKKITECILEISDVKPQICEIAIDKTQPQLKPELSLNIKKLEGKSLVLVDDVLNTGTTLIYTVKHLLDAHIKELKTAVLVDRSHKKFPIKADIKGISLSTSLNETVKVSFGEVSKAELF